MTTALAVPRTRKDKYIRINTGLLPDGSPDPKKLPENLARTGFACPKHQFIEALERPTIALLSRTWGIAQIQMRDWIAKGKWPLERKLYWDGIAAKAGSLTADQLAETRTHELLKRYDSWMLLRNITVGKVREGVVEEQTATGGVRQVALSPTHLKAFSEVMERCDKNIDGVLGIVRQQYSIQNLNDAQAENTVTRKLVYNLRVEQTETVLEIAEAAEVNALTDGPKVLDDPRLPQNFVEAEVLSIT